MQGDYVSRYVAYTDEEDITVPDSQGFNSSSEVNSALDTSGVSVPTCLLYVVCCHFVIVSYYVFSETKKGCKDRITTKYFPQVI